MGMVAMGGSGNRERCNRGIVDNIVIVVIIVVDNNIQIVDDQVVCRRRRHGRTRWVLLEFNNF